MNIPPKYEDLVFQLNELNKREAALREEIEMAKQVQEATDAIVTMVDGQRDHWIEKCGLLKQRLTVAEQRAGDLETALINVRETLGRDYWDQYAGLDETRDILDAALKPAEEVVGSTCNQIREESGLPTKNPCVACNNGACIDRSQP